MDEMHEPFALGVDKFFRGCLEEALKTKLIRDTGEDWTGFLDMGFEPCLQGGEDRCQATGSSLGLVLADLDDTFVEPDVLPVQAKDLDGSKPCKSTQCHKGN